MYKKMLLCVSVFTLVIFMPGCDLLESEQEVALADVPQVVLDAAVAAVSGITLSEAEMVTSLSGTVTYEIEGIANGVLYEIEVSADGTEVEVEQEDEDEDEDEAEGDD